MGGEGMVLALRCLGVVGLIEAIIRADSSLDRPSPEDRDMFAPLVAKAQTKAPASANRKQAPTPSRLLTRPFASSAVEQLQTHERGIGNQATLRLMAQRASDFTGNAPNDHNEQYSDPANSTARRAAAGVSWDFSRIPILPPDQANEHGAPVSPRALPQQAPITLQPKLLVGAVDDPLEQRGRSHRRSSPAGSLASPAATPRKFSVTPGGPAVRRNVFSPIQAASRISPRRRPRW